MPNVPSQRQGGSGSESANGCWNACEATAQARDQSDVYCSFVKPGETFAGCWYHDPSLESDPLTPADPKASDGVTIRAWGAYEEVFEKSACAPPPTAPPVGPPRAPLKPPFRSPPKHASPQSSPPRGGPPRGGAPQAGAPRALPPHSRAPQTGAPRSGSPGPRAPGTAAPFAVPSSVCSCNPELWLEKSRTPRGISPATLPNSQQTLLQQDFFAPYDEPTAPRKHAVPARDLKKTIHSWTIDLLKCCCAPGHTTCQDKDGGVYSHYRRCTFQFYPDRVKESISKNTGVPVFLAFGWDAMLPAPAMWEDEEQKPNPEGKGTKLQITSGFYPFVSAAEYPGWTSDGGHGNTADVIRLVPDLMDRGWVCVYLYGFPCCDTGGLCQGGGMPLDWAFAANAPFYYNNNNRYKDSPDECYLKALFDLASEDALYYHLMANVPGYTTTDFMEGVSAAGYSSAASMVSRLVEEQRKAAVAGGSLCYPRVRAAILDSGASWVCYNANSSTPADVAAPNPVCGTPLHGTDCAPVSEGGRGFFEKDLPFLTQCNAFAQAQDWRDYVGWSYGPPKDHLSFCGQATPVGSCPAWVTEPVWMSEKDALWQQCHPACLLQTMSHDYNADQWGAFFYAWELHKRGVPTFVVESPGAGHGVLYADVKRVLILDVYFLDYYGRTSAYRDQTSETELAKVRAGSAWPNTSDACDANFKDPSKWYVPCVHTKGGVPDYSQPIVDPDTCAEMLCCWQDEMNPKCGAWLTPVIPEEEGGRGPHLQPNPHKASPPAATSAGRGA